MAAIGKKKGLGRAVGAPFHSEYPRPFLVDADVFPQLLLKASSTSFSATISSQNVSGLRSQAARALRIIRIFRALRIEQSSFASGEASANT